MEMEMEGRGRERVVVSAFPMRISNEKHCSIYVHCMIIVSRYDCRADNLWHSSYVEPLQMQCVCKHTAMYLFLSPTRVWPASLIDRWFAWLSRDTLQMIHVTKDPVTWLVD